MLKKYKCSRCETVGEAVSEIQLACPGCGAEMLQIEEEQELKKDPKKVDNLPVAKVASLGFFDLLPVPAGSKLGVLKQQLQNTKEPLQNKNNSTNLGQLENITYNPINDDILDNYKNQKQKTRQTRYYSFLVVLSLGLLLILYSWLIYTKTD